MDKERSEWVKNYMAEKGCTKQAGYHAYKSQSGNAEKSTESKPVTQESKPTLKSKPEKSTETQPVIVKSQITCPTCKGSGKVPITSKPKERELTELPRLLPRRL